MNNPSKVDIVVKENTIDINGFSIEHFLTPIKISKALGEPERIYNNTGRNLKFSGAYIYDRLGTSFAISHERTNSIRLRYGIAEDILLYHSSSVGHVFKGSLTIGKTKFPEPKKYTRRPKIRDKYLEEFENLFFATHPDKYQCRYGFANIDAKFGDTTVTLEIDYRTQQIVFVNILLPTR